MTLPDQSDSREVERHLLITGIPYGDLPRCEVCNRQLFVRDPWRPPVRDPSRSPGGDVKWIIHYRCQDHGL